MASVLAACPDAKIIMAGYSQGAAVVHDAENWLAKNKPAELAHVAGTLLLGDPDRVQDTKAKTFGTAPKDAEGLRVELFLVRPHEVREKAHTREGDAIAAARRRLADGGVRPGGAGHRPGRAGPVP